LVSGKIVGEIKMNNESNVRRAKVPAPQEIRQLQRFQGRQELPEQGM